MGHRRTIPVGTRLERQLKTYQDFEKANDVKTFIAAAIADHKSSDAYDTALLADLYDRQMNATINGYVKTLYTLDVSEGENGERRARAVMGEDYTASNNKLASNFFRRLNTQRVQYSLGAGVSFVQPDEDDVEDKTKEALGDGFDRVIADAAYNACIHGASFVFWNHGSVHVFKFTEFAPLYDERTGTLRAGIRFWQLADNKPMRVTFYREDGYSEWRQDSNRNLRPIDRNGVFADAEVVQGYIKSTSYMPADDKLTVVGEENYGSLPIVPMWASGLKQSTLVGMRAHIDAYDLIKSGFANDLQDCATVYWIVRNANGMTDDDLAQFRDRLKLEHIAKVDGSDGADATAYTQELPYQARQALLKELRDGIYEDFGALDVHAVSAGATNDHIDAAYQPMDENASEFEHWVGECIRQVLALAGIDDKPVFTRQRISNQKEQVEMVVQEAQWLDTRTILQLLPNVRPDQVAAILERMDGEDMARFGIGQAEGEVA